MQPNFADKLTALTYQSLMSELEVGRLHPVYFFYGPEEVLIERALGKLKDVAIQEGSADFNWSVFRAGDSEVNWPEFADAVTAMPLIPSHRVVVLKELKAALRNRGIVQLLEGAIRQPADELTLVLSEADPDLKKQFYKDLLTKSTAVNFPRSSAAEIQKQLKSFAAEYGKEISATALERILTETDPNLRDLLSKLEVLITYAGDKATIEPEDVDECTAFTREVEIYRLLQALGNRDASAVRMVREQLLQRKVELGSLFYLLYRQIWAMYRMKYLQEHRTPANKWQELLNIKPSFLQNRYRGYLSNYSRDELGRSLEIIDRADRTRKTSAMQDDFILRTLTESLLQP
jgi:DNA polymerase-3 subunit delta